jgi:tRNA(Ile)-lysidine synthase
VSAVRTAVRRLVTAAKKAGQLSGGQLAVAVSGGADSLALAAAAQHQARRLDVTVHGLIVDHGLQAGSDKIAAQAAEQLTALGIPHIRILTTKVDGPGGMEAAARRARYEALRGALPAADSIVLLGHTRDDQAETVLLGLGRGSGPRSIAGMRPLDPPWGRPLLTVTRAQTERACTAQGLTYWSDPHNVDPAFTRVRLRREVLPLLEDVLQGGVADALARTAAQLREDNDALDALAAEMLVDDPAELSVEALRHTPAAIRRRVLRNWLMRRSVTELTDAQLRDIDALIGEWRGQGGVLLRGGLVAQRAHGRLQLDRASP